MNQRIADAQAALRATDLPSRAEYAWWSTADAMTISASVLIFGFLICCLAAYLVKSGKSAETVLRMFGTILIVISTLFLIVAGYSDKQIAPAMGLLGTVVGYLLGKDARPTSSEKEKAQ